jgi:sugar/nucleoside kinase (ribokinase family)
MNRIDLQLKRATKSASVLGSGFIAIDIVQGQDDLFAATGGSCGNVLLALAWLGWTSMPVARLGCDMAGEFVAEEMKSAGVKLDFLQRSEAVPTPVVIQQFVESSNGSRRHRFSLVCPECGAWLPRYRSIVLTHAREAMQGKVPKAFYFDRTSPSTVAMAEWAKKSGAVVFFEPSSIGDDSLFVRAVDACDILKFSNERFSGDSELSRAQGPSLVVRTMGANGLQARWKGRWSSFEPFVAPRIVDAAGAGDWCSVALLHLLAQEGAQGFRTARKAEVERALRLGQALAALSCGFEGARGLTAAIKSVDRLNGMLRNMVGGGGVFDNLELSAVRSAKVAICKLCSDAGRGATATSTKKSA